jgi:hypothetical protein
MGGRGLKRSDRRKKLKHRKQRSHRIPEKQRSIERRAESFELNKIIGGMIEDYWPDSDVEVFPEVRGIKFPDILITRNELEIPVEVKTRKYGYFFSPPVNGQQHCMICYSPTEEHRNYNIPTPLLETEDFSNQLTAMLMNYKIALFLINGRVRRNSPVRRTEERGLVILSELKTLEQSLETAYGYLDNLQQVSDIQNPYAIV